MICLGNAYGGDCNKEAEWVRHTQFAGNHPFCDDHAKQEKDFGKTDPSYFFWEKLDCSTLEK